MTLHYLTFMGRNLENKKKSTLVWTMNITSMNNNNIMNSVGIFNDSGTTNNRFKE